MLSGLFIILIISNAESFLPDDSVKIIFGKIKDKYENKKYLEVITILKPVVPELKKTDKSKAYEYLAYSYTNLGDEKQAVEAFKRLLRLCPKFEPSAVCNSPSVKKIYQKAKTEGAHEAGACSCFIPGMGQLLKGEERKGKIIIFTAGTSFISSIILWLITFDKRDKYLKAEPDNIKEIEQRYQTYKYWFNGAILSSTIFIGTYIYSIYDAWSSKTVRLHKTKHPEFKIHLDTECRKTYFGLIYKFSG